MKQGILYKDGKKTLDLRLFIGGFAFEKTSNTYSIEGALAGRALLQSGAKTGRNDYLYDETLFGRTEQLGPGTNVNPLNPPNTINQKIYGRQILNSDAGFRNFATLGSTNSFLSALNITIPAPIPVNIGLYGDVVYWQSPSGYTWVSGVAGTTYEYYPSAMNFTYNGGIYLTIVKDVFSIYLPVIASQDVKDSWKINGLENPFSRMSFVLNLNKMNPIEFIRNIKL